MTFLILVSISQYRIPLVSEEELTGICVFRSCHTLFNFQGSLPVRRGGEHPASGASLADSFAIIPPLPPFVNTFFYFFSGFLIFLYRSILCVERSANIHFVICGRSGDKNGRQRPAPSPVREIPPASKHRQRRRMPSPYAALTTCFIRTTPGPPAGLPPC